MHISIEDEFINSLRDELMKRIKKNPNYSLRAFADFLGYDASLLSKILNRKRKAGERIIRAVSNKMQWNHFLEELLREVPETNRKFDDIDDDIFSIISDWYHFAILEIIQLDAFDGSIEWVSKKLNLDFQTTQESFARLERLEFLTKDKQGLWRDTTSGRSTTLTSNRSSEASREMQKQLLQKSIDLISSLSHHYRDNTSISFCFDSSRIEDAKNDLKNFRRKFSQKYAYNNEKKDSVYNLSLSFFPLTKRDSLETD